MIIKKVKHHGFNLAEFYKSETKLDDIIERARNHPVIIEAKIGDGRIHKLAVPIDVFCEVEIEPIIKKMFMRLNADEFIDMRCYLPNFQHSKAISV